MEVKRNELASSLKELSKQDPEYASLQRVSIVSVEDVQLALPEDVTLVEYFVARDEVLAFLITKHSAAVHRHLCTIDRVEHLQERLHLQLDKVLIGSKYVSQHSEQLKESTLRHLGELYTELLAPLAPHLGEELWQRLGHTASLAHGPFPVADPAYLIEDVVEYPVQVNGKVRGRITVPADADADVMEAAALADEKVQAFLAGATPKKVIVVAGRLVNLVV